MKINKIKFKNVNSYGNNFQEIVFTDTNGLYLLQGDNGEGKCLYSGALIDIEFTNEETKKQVLLFLKEK